VKTIQGDCIKVLKGFADDTFDSVVTDPPYGLEFMGKDWDSPKLWRNYDNDDDRAYRSEGRSAPKFSTSRPTFKAGYAFQAWCEDWAAECLRVLKPGGYLVAFGGTRTYHRLACAIEDAGFEIRDSLHWIYGSGFPKSRDISKAIDSEAGAVREVIGHRKPEGSAIAGNAAPDNTGSHIWTGELRPKQPATEDAAHWQGWGTALKPAHEPIVLARKPLSEKTVAANVLKFGTGGLNIDGCRVVSEPNRKSGWSVSGSKASDNACMENPNRTREPKPDNPNGRWPPNVILGNEAIAEMDRQSGNLSPCGGPKRTDNGEDSMFGIGQPGYVYKDTGGASRFFPCFRYNAKASKKERPVVDGIPAHPTVKPVALMRWLAKLVTPPGGCVLDPFAGTGTTAEACQLEGFDCVLIEQNPDSIRHTEKRMEKYGYEPCIPSAN
jgi:site-specific DNA-methyltransferase (adenine-specific)